MPTGPTLFLSALIASISLAATAAGAQLLGPEPLVRGLADGIGRVTEPIGDRVQGALDRLRPADLLDAQQRRLKALVQAHPEALEMSRDGPAVRGQLIAIEPTPEVLSAAERLGFSVGQVETLGELGLRLVTLDVPAGLTVDRALARLQRAVPAGEFAANHLHVQSGSAGASAAGALAGTSAAPPGPAIGVIDGGVAGHPALQGKVQQRGFAKGAPAASAHGTAVASLAAGRGSINGAAPGAPLLVADIYGRDPAGGNAVALIRALGWLAGQRVSVIALSLVGPANPLVARAVAAVRARGIHVVAAVGNGGPAAPAAYPASYPGVIAVTGVDGRNRVLIEAGRSLHLDYAAPGADMAAASPGGGISEVRGTSFAVPLVAGRLWRAAASSPAPLARLDAEALDLGPRGPDKRFGRGVVCGDCRTAIAKNGKRRD